MKEIQDFTMKDRLKLGLSLDLFVVLEFKVSCRGKDSVHGDDKGLLRMMVYELVMDCYWDVTTKYKLLANQI